MSKYKIMTKPDRNWSILFKRNNILDKIKKDGFYKISSSEINKLYQARLMTKFDHRESLPRLFRDNNLGILPTKRGEYIISQFDAYEDLIDIDKEPTIVSPRRDIDSIGVSDIFSESTALNYAKITGMLNDFFESDLVEHTIDGRMGTREFRFNISDKNNTKLEIYVEGAQIEIDGGYETESNLYLIEAKNIIPNDFIIRQLYYPMRLWSAKLKERNSKKKVVPIFLAYSGGEWNFYKYMFNDLYDYNSIELIKGKRYEVSDNKIKLEDIKKILYTDKELSEPKKVYPQANSVKRLINIMERLYIEGLSKLELVMELGIVERQVDYYINALDYLDLIDSKEESGIIVYTLSKLGKELMIKEGSQKKLFLIEIILKNLSFNIVMREYLKNGYVSQERIVHIMKESYVYNITSESTYYRRASTVKAWIEWIHNQIEKR